MLDLYEILHMLTSKHITKNLHITLQKRRTTLILLLFKLHH